MNKALRDRDRITLAVSVALLVHTVLVATFSSFLPEHRHHPVTVSVQLMPSGNMPSRQDTQSHSRPSVVAEPFRITNPREPWPTPKVLATANRQLHTTPAPEPGPVWPETEPDAAAKKPPAPTASRAGEQSRPQGDAEQELTLRSQAPSEQSTYVSLLAQTIASNARIPKLDHYKKGQILATELELNLMSNGALVSARIAKSSGNDGLDQRVYRAALAASPYPEPPATAAGRRRFRVEVRYTF